MQKNIYKKIINSVFLITILFSLLFPFNQTLAQTNENPLSISTVSTSIDIGQETFVHAYLEKTSTINSFNGGEIISFYIMNSEMQVNFYKSCQMIKPSAEFPECTISFTSPVAGTFLIKATTKINSFEYSSGNNMIVVNECSSPKIISQGKCIDPNVVVNNGNGTTNSTDTTYSPLAPLPGMDSVIDTATDCAFGKYLNIMIKLIIGLAAVMAMVMIVMGGIEYMTSELISGKEAGKETVQHALLGLVLALSAYLILNTINPKLLNACLNELPEAKITIEEAPPTSSDFSLNETIPGGSVGSCTEGIIKINTTGGSITLCKRIGDKVQALINKAWSENLKLFGWGWRSNQRQIELRTINGCPDIYKSPPNKCRVPTAIPGTSMHEVGLAIDFTCEGVAIQTHDNKCYLWLKQNASSFLTNIKSEAWHWSTNGR